MNIIDAHVHLYPPEINRAPAAWAAAHAEPHWAALCTRVRRDGRAVQEFPTVDELLHTMDDAGVTRAILQGWYWETHESCVMHNAFYEKCMRAHPDRLSACAALLPASDTRIAGRERVLEIVRRAADSGFCGLGELSPHSQRILPDDPVLNETLELSGTLGLAVNFHVTENAGEAGQKNYPGKIETPLGDFVSWARAHPRTRMVLAHWGARLPLDSEWGAAVRACENLFYDTAASPLIYGAGNAADSLPGGSANVWREMAGAAGPDRILFGTDYPLVLYPKTETRASMRSLADEARASGLSNREIIAVLSGNAHRIFQR